MYTRYFGLSENPFALSPDPRYLYSSRRHQEALAHLTYGMARGGGFVQLTGEVGTGKTMMVRTLLERLPASVDVAFVVYPYLTVQEFVTAICEDLRIAIPKDDTSLKALIDALRTYLLENHARGRRTVLIIDEAQKLSHEILEQVRLLTNLETTKEKLLQILLIGQPELDNLLAQPGLRQLAQRITARYKLQPLNRNETREYILHRLAVAGAKAQLFSDAAMHWIYRAARGTPRIVNVICDRALLGAYSSAKPAVNLRLARRAAREVAQPGIHFSRARGALAAGAALALIAIGVVTWQWRASVPAVVATAPAAAPAVANDGGAKLAAAQPAEKSASTLAELLAAAQSTTDTDSAFTRLFARWELDYAPIATASGCDFARDAGLRCLVTTGTWNNLRQFNRPAILELVDGQGARHHVVLLHLDNDAATLDIGGSAQRLGLSQVDAHWFGKALLVWRPPVTEAVLRRGMRGPAVAWLRTALAQSLPDAAGARVDRSTDKRAQVFDIELEEQVKRFQALHQLPVDGVVGELTLVRLKSDDPSLAMPVAVKTVQAGN